MAFNKRSFFYFLRRVAKLILCANGLLADDSC